MKETVLKFVGNAFHISLTAIEREITQFSDWHKNQIKLDYETKT